VDNIDNVIVNLAALPMWVNRDASSTAFGGKQSYGFWQSIFESGASPNGQRVMPSGLDLMKMISQPASK
jgi:hypothetical protein